MSLPGDEERGTANNGDMADVYQNSTNSTANNVASIKPNKRQKNPLGEFSSYTYQIVLAMVTPEAYIKFVSSGRKDLTIGNNPSDPHEGIFLIAQSGGINNTTSKRAPGFELDYYIDNLKIKSAIAPGKSQTESVITEVAFDIVEPYGFSFPTNLRRASSGIAALSKLKGITDLNNATKQLFILGVRFLGYDENGNIIPGNATSTLNRFYDINIKSMEFKLGGGATTYHITAVSMPASVSQGLKRGAMNTGGEFTGSTVGDILRQICVKMTKDQKDAHKGNEELANTFSVAFRGPGADRIDSSSFISQADLDKAKWPMSQSVRVSTTPNPLKRNVVFKNSTPVAQAFRQIISQSLYLENALKVVYSATEEPETPKIPGTVTPIAWYNLTAEVTPKAWDSAHKDFAYDIVYVIQPYQTPFVLSSIANKAAAYYGPVKRYDYLFSGGKDSQGNSEVIRFEQKLNTSYFTISLDDYPPLTNNSTATGGNADITVVPGLKQNSSSIGRVGDSTQAAASYTTSLLDPGTWAHGKLEILGDPDWLVHDDAPAPGLENHDPYYGSNGYSINPTAGQVFIEINFSEAVDYNNNTGLLNINDKILFWDYSPEALKVINGISYQVYNCISTFRSGSFKQELDLVLNPLGDTGATARSKAQRDAQPTSGLKPAPIDADAQLRRQLEINEAETAAEQAAAQAADDDAARPGGAASKITSSIANSRFARRIDKSNNERDL
jgi:hypothetical protein